MIRARRQRILYFVVVGALAVALVSLLVYLFASGSPRAIPALFYLVGFAVGSFSLYFATRFVAPKRTLVGRLVWGGAMVAIVVLGFLISVEASASLGRTTILGEFVRGLGLGIGLTALMRLTFPYSWARERQER